MRNYDRAYNIIKKIKLAGHEAYIVGGWSREFLKAKINNYIFGYDGDIDIATSAGYDELKEIFPFSEKINSKTSYPIIIVDGIEVATYRKDINCFGRDCEWETTSDLKEDASRRDFRFNAIYYDPIVDKYVDPYLGIKDLKENTVNFIGRPIDRINEDFLRILRFVRFCAEGYYFFNRDFDVCKSCIAYMKMSIPFERIYSEVTKILAKTKGAGLLHLYDVGFFDFYFEEVKILKGIDHGDAEYHLEGDVLKHTSMVLNSADFSGLNDTEKETLIWACLFHDIGKCYTARKRIKTNEDGKDLCLISYQNHDRVGRDIVKYYMAKYKLPKSIFMDVFWLVRNHMDGHNLLSFKDERKEQFYLNKNYKLLDRLMRADCLGKIPEKSTEKLDKILKDRDDFLHERNKSDLKNKGIDGNTVMWYYSIKPGPDVGKKLLKLKLKAIKNPEMTKEELLDACK